MKTRIADTIFNLAGKDQSSALAKIPGCSGAVYSECERYRYRLWRNWDHEKPRLCMVMLNPSTATELQNDPTVERCQRRAIEYDCGAVEVVNIFAFRSTDPKALYNPLLNPVGEDNNDCILEATSLADIVLCAWGTHGAYRGRGHEVESMLRFYDGSKDKLHVLGLNHDGSPKHPLYVGYDKKPVKWVTT